jgi:hypothetical protein
MSAARHINPNQLKMFMTAHEITAQYQVGEGDREGYERAYGRPYDDAAVLRAKYSETTAAGGEYAAHVRQHGVMTPVEILHQPGSRGRSQVWNGNHRVAVEAFENRHRLMPVVHHANVRDGMDYEDPSVATLKD